MTNTNQMTFEVWWKKLGHYLAWSTPKIAANITWQRAILANECAENVKYLRLVIALQAFFAIRANDGECDSNIVIKRAEALTAVEIALEDITGAEK